MSKRRHAAHAEEHENHERWLITYADMITLLMAFFVMMYGMSILDLKKFADFKAGAAKQLGKSPAVPGGMGILPASDGIAEAAAAPIGSGPRSGAGDSLSGEVSREDLGTLALEVRRHLDDAGLTEGAEIGIDPRGLVIWVADRVLFDSGQVRLNDDGLIVLDQLADVLRRIDNLVVVEGHTDNIPLRSGSAIPTNWELSTLRATQVLRWMVQYRGLPAVRVSAAGYADTRPRVANDTGEHRALNRRVEIIVVAAEGLEEATGADTTEEAAALPADGLGPSHPRIEPLRPTGSEAGSTESSEKKESAGNGEEGH